MHHFSDLQTGDFDFICRICLSKNDLKVKFTTDDLDVLHKSLKCFLSIIITEEDSLPKRVCKKCFIILKESYKLKLLSECTENILNNILNSRISEPKVEISDIRNEISLPQELKPSNPESEPSIELTDKPQTLPPKKNRMCEVCGKTFSREFYLKMHRRSHMNDRRYCCTECSKKFVQKCSLTIHLRTHSGEKPYKCKICQSAFVSSGCLKKHLIIHDESLTFKCNKCCRKFCSLEAKNEHLQNFHNGDVKFICTICLATYNHCSGLSRHYRKKHPEAKHLK